MTERLAGMSDREDEIAARLARVHGRLLDACAAAGRDASDVRLVVVTKTWPVQDALHVVRLGVRDLGESRDDEAAAKVAEVGTHDPEIRWHFLGQVQSRKARSIASYATTVHSVDRRKVADALGSGAVRAGRTVEALVQLSLDGDPGRGGATADALLPLADHVAGLPGLRLAGLMAVPPQDSDPRRAYEQAAAVAERLRNSHPGASVLSLGMSSDLEAAVEAGSTMVRVGTAVFGHRATMLR